MDIISYNGITSASLGVIVDGEYTKSIPKRKTTSITIPGRNGVILQDEESYENCQQEYTLYWLPDRTRDTQVLDWLRQDGYFKFQHSDAPDYFYLAQAILPSVVTNHRDCYHEIRVAFNCKPQMYLESGEQAESFTAPGKIWNPTMYDSKPIIKVYGNADSEATLTINGLTIKLSSIDEYVTLDSELQDAFKGGENKNSTVSGEFPTLKGNTLNFIEFTPSITKVEIIPRWWTL